MTENKLKRWSYLVQTVSTQPYFTKSLQMASFNYAMDKGIVVSFKCIFVYIMQLSESKVILILAVKGGSGY